MSRKSVQYKGKYKYEIVDEAFNRLGGQARCEEISAYAKREYGVPDDIPFSVYYAQKAKYKRELSAGTPASLKPPKTYPKTNASKIDLVVEAFKDLGENAKEGMIKNHIKDKHGVEVFHATVQKGRKRSRQTMKKLMAVQETERKSSLKGDLQNLIKVKTLAAEVGGINQLCELIGVLKDAQL